jgi:hypothetical protein
MVFLLCVYSLVNGTGHEADGKSSFYCISKIRNEDSFSQGENLERVIGIYSPMRQIVPTAVPITKYPVIFILLMHF